MIVSVPRIKTRPTWETFDSRNRRSNGRLKIEIYPNLQLGTERDSIDALASGVELREAADFLARMVLSYITSPGSWNLEDPVQVSKLVRTELLAGILAGPAR